MVVPAIVPPGPERVTAFTKSLFGGSVGGGVEVAAEAEVAEAVVAVAEAEVAGGGPVTTTKEPMMVGCGSQWYVAEPGVKFTSQVSRPVPATSVVQSEGGMQFTASPSRWKLCVVDESSTCTVYTPAWSALPFRSFPCGSRREISWPGSSSIEPISVPPRGWQTSGGGGGSVGIRRYTAPLPEPACTRAQASSPKV